MIHLKIYLTYLTYFFPLCGDKIQTYIFFFQIRTLFFIVDWLYLVDNISENVYTTNLIFDKYDSQLLKNI